MDARPAAGAAAAEAAAAAAEAAAAAAAAPGLAALPGGAVQLGLLLAVAAEADDAACTAPPPLAPDLCLLSCLVPPPSPAGLGDPPTAVCQASRRQVLAALAHKAGLPLCWVEPRLYEGLTPTAGGRAPPSGCVLAATPDGQVWALSLRAALLPAPVRAEGGPAVGRPLQRPGEGLEAERRLLFDLLQPLAALLPLETAAPPPPAGAPPRVGRAGDAPARGVLLVGRHGRVVALTAAAPAAAGQVPRGLRVVVGCGRTSHGLSLEQVRLTEWRMPLARVDAARLSAHAPDGRGQRRRLLVLLSRGRLYAAALSAALHGGDAPLAALGEPDPWLHRQRTLLLPMPVLAPAQQLLSSFPQDPHDPTGVIGVTTAGERLRLALPPGSHPAAAQQLPASEPDMQRQLQQVLGALQRLQAATAPLQPLLMAHDAALRATSAEVQLLRRLLVAPAAPGPLPLTCDASLEGVWGAVGRCGSPQPHLAARVTLRNGSGHALGAGWQLLVGFRPQAAGARAWQVSAALPALEPGACTSVQVMLPASERSAGAGALASAAGLAAGPHALAGLGPWAAAGGRPPAGQWLRGGWLQASLVKPLLGSATGARAAVAVLCRRRVSAVQLAHLASGNPCASAALAPAPHVMALLWGGRATDPGRGALLAVAGARRAVDGCRWGGACQRPYTCALTLSCVADCEAAPAAKRRPRASDATSREGWAQATGAGACAEAVRWLRECLPPAAGSVEVAAPAGGGRQQWHLRLGDETVSVACAPVVAASGVPDGGGGVGGAAVSAVLAAPSPRSLAEAHGAVLAAALDSLGADGEGGARVRVVGSRRGMQAALQRLQAVRRHLRGVRDDLDGVLELRQRCGGAPAAAAALLNRAAEVRGALDAAYGHTLHACSDAWQLQLQT